MSSEQKFSGKISENIIEIFKNSSLYDKITSLTNKANNTIYGVGGFCFVVTLFSIMNYNKTKITIEIIDKKLSNISASCYDKNINVEIITNKLDNIEQNITTVNNDIISLNSQLKKLLVKVSSIQMSQKQFLEKSTTTDSSYFLTLENECREKFQEKSIQNEENEIFKKCEKNQQEDLNEYNDIMNECYDIIPCNNVKKYANSNYNLFNIF